MWWPRRDEAVVVVREGPAKAYGDRLCGCELETSSLKLLSTTGHLLSSSPPPISHPLPPHRPPHAHAHAVAPALALALAQAGLLGWCWLPLATRHTRPCPNR